jgi:hypothetical protein
MGWQYVLVRAYVRDDAHPEHPIVIPPPDVGIWPDPGVPTHPIVLPPGGTIGGTPEHPIYNPPAEPGVPAHPIVLPPGGEIGGTPEHPIYYPPSVWPGPGRPAHPIAPGGPPPSVWPPPGVPTHPIELPPDGVIGGTPEHPIYYPPPQPGEPAHPIVLPPDGEVGGTPEHPIYYPPSGTPEHPIVFPEPLPVVAPESLGSHPLAPDLHAGMGYWAMIAFTAGAPGTTAWVQTMLEPSDHPTRPDETQLPGAWVTVLDSDNVMQWAWVAEDSAPPHPEPRD